jgi:hypothetical protein
LDLVLGAELGKFLFWKVSIDYEHGLAVLPVCSPVFAGATPVFAGLNIFCGDQELLQK